ncbi:MAG: TM2 domain-containing protein [Rhodobacteraceae bacterium]|nr:TM2 domain-containing protein [Paracoccaceae bacterium]
MVISTDQQILVEARITNDKKSIGVVFALWFFLGIISAHRFYLNRPLSAILQITSYFFLVGFVWWIIDAFLLGDMVQKHSADLREKMLSDLITAQTDSH